MALFDEASKLLPNKQSPVTEQVLNEAQYAKATLKELFRLRPISVGTGRVLSEKAVFSDYEVPENVCTHICGNALFKNTTFTDCCSFAKPNILQT